MKSFVLAMALVLMAVSGFGQTRINLKVLPTDENFQSLAARLPELEAAARRAVMRLQIEAALGGLAVTAERMELDPTGKIVTASGGLRIRTNEVIITADSAVIANGQIQLGANARVVLDYPVKMIQ